jgi:nicotinamidase-related amidase
MSTTLLTSLAEQIEPAHTAVIVVDPQKDFCATDGVMGRVFGLDMSPVQAAVPALNRFIEDARAAGVPVAWVREVFSPDRMMPAHRLINGDGDDLQLIREGTDGVDWYEGMIPPAPDEPTFTKWHYDAFEGTELDLWLRARDVVTLVMTGFTTNVCVETTARHAYIKGYYVVTLSDCTAAPSQAEHDAALVNLGRYFGRVATSGEVVATWAERLAPAAR